MTLEKSQTTNLNLVVKKEKDSVEGSKGIITYRGTVITFGTAALLASSYHLIKTVPELSYRITNEGIFQNILTLLGIGTASIVIPASVMLLKYQVPAIKENIRMLKLEKQWLKRDEALLKKQEEQIYQKMPTK